MIGLYMGYGYGMGYGFYFDPTYILIIIAGIISVIAQIKIKSTYSKYSGVWSASGMTGAQVARQILDSHGLYDIPVMRVSGSLTDHYHPGKRIINLSDSVYDSTSVAAIGVAAHECGHAIQHANGYALLSIRSALVPVANIGSQLSWVFIILGIIFSFNQTLITIGIIMFSAAVLFQLITLPVEFNASKRAMDELESSHILVGNELKCSRKVLSAAALTYVAAAATAILQLLRLIILFGGRNHDDD